MKKPPKISIITVNYNKGNFIEDTIKSIINQKYKNLEYIIIDGASTDNSIEIIKKYDQNISYWVSEPDKGMTYALVKGFNLATGDVFAWLNSDDLFCDDTLDYIAKSYVKHNWDFCYGDMEFIDEHNKYKRRIYSLPTTAKYYANGAISMPQPSCFWSKNVYKNVGGLDVDFKLRMDADLFTRIISKSNIKIVRTNKVLSKFRIHDGQSHSWSTEDEYNREIDLVKNKYPINFLSKLIIKLKIYKTFMFIKRLTNI